MTAAVASKSRETVKSTPERRRGSTPAGAPVQGLVSRLVALAAPGGMVHRACHCGGGAAQEDDPTRSLTVQKQLSISTPGDPFELEADRIADQVTGSFAASAAARPQISRLDGDGTSLNRACTSCTSPETNQPPDAEASAIDQAVREPGQPLEPATRSLMDRRFGYDFGHVRVHTGAQAAESARKINALAYTYRGHVVFGSGQYEPSSGQGLHLLTHELAHVVQQGGANSASVQRACGPAQIAARPTTCTITKNATAVGTRFYFKTDCDDFADGQQAAFDNFVATIPSSSTVNVLGLASAGAAVFKENLSCSRALKVASALVAKSLTVGSVQGTGGIGAAGDSTLEAVDLQTQTSPSPSAPASPGPGPAPAAPAGGPVTVTFPTVSAASTPAGGANRIPPRVETPITVQVNGTPAANAPIVLSVMNAGAKNGTVLIDGGAATTITATKTVKLKGGIQTAQGSAGNLALLAKQSNNTVGQSNVFSVAAIPQNLAFTFSSIITGTERGFRALGKWESDSGSIADLDQAIVQEHIEKATETGGFAGTGINTSGPIPANGAEIDKHSVPVSMCNQVGKLELKQTHTYNDTRTGSTGVPITNSGFVILHDVKNKDPAFGAGREVITSKNGSATTANTIQSGAGSGSIVQPQNV